MDRIVAGGGQALATDGESALSIRNLKPAADSGSLRSRTASAAYRSASRMSSASRSGFRVGGTRISCSLMPTATIARTVATVGLALTSEPHTAERLRGALLGLGQCGGSV
jgi:hypothetical protein